MGFSASRRRAGLPGLIFGERWPSRLVATAAEKRLSFRHNAQVVFVKKPHSGQFKPGNRLGGRPLGSRNKLTEVALGAAAASLPRAVQPFVVIVSVGLPMLPSNGKPEQGATYN
jgi:hypothetical protein